MKYRVWAKMISYAYLDVEAENADDALAVAEDTDGGEFISSNGGDWEIIYDDVKEVE